MMHVAPRIGVAETGQGLLVSLPPRFWLLVSLRRTFRKVAAGVVPWTYLIRDTRAGRRLEEWIAAVELDVIAEARRRAWNATDSDWFGAAPTPAAAVACAPAAPAVVEIPAKGTARATLKLLRTMQAGQVLVVTVAAPGKPRSYRLAPSGRTVRTTVAEGAIEGRYLIPNGDGLFGPDWSQTWRAPQLERVDAATKRRGKGSTADRGERPASPARPSPRPAQGRPDRRPRRRQEGEVASDGGRRARARQRGGVA